jgi:hypothetical protein
MKLKKKYEVKEKGEKVKGACAITKKKATAIVVNEFDCEIPVDLYLFEITQEDPCYAKYVGVRTAIYLSPDDIKRVLESLSYHYEYTDEQREHEKNMFVADKIQKQVPDNLGQYNENFL